MLTHLMAAAPPPPPPPSDAPREAQNTGRSLKATVQYITIDQISSIKANIFVTLRTIIKFLEEKAQMTDNSMDLKGILVT